MFSLSEIDLNYGELKVLEQFSLDCRKQQFIALYGPSGVGKTSILNLLAAIIKPQAGDVQADFQRIAYVFQEPRLIPWLSVRENLEIGLFNMGLDANEREKRVENLLPLLDLVEFGAYFPGQLSGGMKQRVSIGRAFIIQPDLLLLDEPFTGLDENLKNDMQELLISLEQWHVCTTVMVTHDINEAIKLSDRIVVVQGRPCRIILDVYPQSDRLLLPDYATQIRQSISRALAPLEETLEYA